MNYIFAALTGALLLSLSDLCTNYALENGLTNLKHTFWSHGVVYLIAILVAVYLMSDGAGITSNIRFPENKKAGLASLMAGLFGFLALLTINYSFSRSKNIGYTVALISTTSLITLVLSNILFNKPLETKGTVGIFTILIGVYLISLCKNEIAN